MTGPTFNESDWTDDIELLLNKIRINSKELSEYHRNTYLSLKDKIKWFRIPVLILSAINSVFSVGLSAFIKQHVVSVLNCLISLICGIIVSIELFLQVQGRMDLATTNSRDFYILSTDIFKTLSLERPNRQDKSIAYLEEKYSLYCKYRSASNILTEKMLDQLESIPIDRNEIVYLKQSVTPVLTPCSGNAFKRAVLKHIAVVAPPPPPPVTPSLTPVTPSISSISSISSMAPLTDLVAVDVHHVDFGKPIVTPTVVNSVNPVVDRVIDVIDVVEHIDAVTDVSDHVADHVAVQIDLDLDQSDLEKLGRLNRPD